MSETLWCVKHDGPLLPMSSNDPFCYADQLPSSMAECEQVSMLLVPKDAPSISIFDANGRKKIETSDSWGAYVAAGDSLARVVNRLPAGRYVFTGSAIEGEGGSR